MLNTFSRICFLLFLFVVCFVANTSDAVAAGDNDSTALQKAAHSGDIAKAQSLIREGADVNSKSEDGDTPLIAASGAGHIDMVKFLIANGADVNGKGAFGYTALLRAVDYRQYDAAKVLIENGADLNVKDERDGGTGLHIAAVRGDKELVELIIANGADVDAEDNEGGTALHGVAFVGDKDVAELLIAKGADVNDKGWRKRTPLHISAGNGHKGVVELLIVSGANVNAEDTDGRTPLWAASTNSRVEVMKVLIDGGADVNPKRGKTTWAPLNWAAGQGHYALVKLLIAKGADVNGKGEFGGTALHRAARNGHKEVVQYLISKDAEVNSRGRNGETPLHYTVRQGRKDMAELLIAEGADVDAKDNNGWAPLRVAVENDRKEIAELLLASGGDVNARDNKGRTPLHRAAWHDNTAMAKLLIANGADVNARGRWSANTPLFTAAEAGSEGVAKLLIANGANINAQAHRSNPLCYACEHHHKGMIWLLIRNGADVNGRSGAACLQYAVMMGQMDLAKLLIARGADVNAKASYERTPLHIAASYGRKDVAEFLIGSGADVNAEDRRGYTPLYFATLKQGTSYKDLAKFLRKHGAKLSDKVGDGVQERDDSSGVPQEGKVRDWYVPFISSIAFSPDGQSLAACYHKPPRNRAQRDAVSYVILWDVKTRDERYLNCEPMQGRKRGPPVGPYQAVFTTDGHTLLVVGSRGRVRAINVSTGEQIPGNGTLEFPESTEGRPLREFGEAVTAVASSPDGRTIATGDWHGVVRLRDAATGKSYRTFERRIGRVACLAFSPNGQTLATGGYRGLSHRRYPWSMEPDNTIKLWDITTGELHKSLKGHERPVRFLVFSPDGKRIASIDGFNVVKVWNLETGKQQLTHLQTTSVDSPYEPICFSPDSSKIAVGFQNFGISTWDVATGQAKLLPFPKALKWPRCSGVFYPDCGKVVFGGKDTIRLWDFKTNDVRDVVRVEDKARPMALSPDGKLLAFAELNRLTLWNLVSNRARFTVDTGANVPQFSRGHVVTFQRWICHLTFSPNSSIVAASQEIYGLQFWDTTQGRLIRSLDTRTIPCNIQYAAFSPDGKIIATCGEDSVITRLWEVETGKLIRTIK